MKIFTKFELEQFEAYPILKRILNEAEIQIFFNTPQAERGTLIPNKTVRQVTPTPTPTPNTLTLVAPPKFVVVHIETPKAEIKKVGTQMCTREEIYAMAMDYMQRDFEWQGVVYNFNKLGWKFEFHNKKGALGTCCYNRFKKNGKIQLSEWIIENSMETFDKWVNTMLHEIAHAIDYTQNGNSSHDWNWKRIARSIGCDAERTTSLEFADLTEKPISKYTMVCANGHTSPSFKKRASHRSVSCGQCAKESGISGFNRDFILTQIQNW